MGKKEDKKELVRRKKEERIAKTAELKEKKKAKKTKADIKEKKKDIEETGEIPEKSSVGDASMLSFIRPLLTGPGNNHIESSVCSVFNKVIRSLGYTDIKSLPLWTVVGEDDQRDMLVPVGVLEAWKRTVSEERLVLEEQIEAAEIRKVDRNLVGQVEPLKVTKFAKMLGHVRRLMLHNLILTDGSPLLKSFTSAISSGKVKRLLAFDVEAFEHDQRHLLELGAAIYDIPTDGCDKEPKIKSFHFIMEENVGKKNGRWCANNRDNYSFGESKRMGTTDVFRWLLAEMRKPNTAFIGHNLQADLKYLMEGRTYKPTTNPKTHIPTGTFPPFTHQLLRSHPSFDTQAIFREVHLRPHDEKLEKLLKHYGIEHDYLHNAGNDAYFTLVVALKMAGLPHQAFESVKSGKMTEDKIVEEKADNKRPATTLEEPKKKKKMSRTK